MANKKQKGGAHGSAGINSQMSPEEIISHSSTLKYPGKLLCIEK
jgi:hypothetical protein